MKKYNLIFWLACIIVLLLIIYFFIDFFYPSQELEAFSSNSFDLSQLNTIPSTGIPDGSYLVIVTDEKGVKSDKMAPIPNGFVLAVSGDKTKGIVPNTAATIETQVNYGNNVGKSIAVDIPSGGIKSGNYQVDIKDSLGNIVPKMAPIPSGYMSFITNDSSGKPVKRITPDNTLLLVGQDKLKKDTNVSVKYDISNINTVYHDSADTAADVKANWDVSFNDFSLITNDGNPMKVEKLPTQPWATFYQPGDYPYGSSYVPSYEDSVYLSRTTGFSETAPYQATSDVAGGFCSKYNNDKQKLEEQCKRLDANTCASTQCCTLLGGSKCVSGNESGPYVKSNYNDPLLKNKDFYYYQGKCYGNCVN
jgi:hypothetical protein